MRQKALPLAQNKIDYIVYHNPDKVTELLYNQGFEAPKNPKDLAEAIRELSRKRGRKFLKELVKLHPDKALLISLDKESNKSTCKACNSEQYDTKANYCKGCGHSNYIGLGDEDNFIGQFDSYDTKDLEKYYKGIVQKSNADPSNKNLAQEVQMIWNQIRQRKGKGKNQEEGNQPSRRNLIYREDLILIGVVFLAGALVGHGLKFNFNNG